MSSNSIQNNYSLYTKDTQRGANSKEAGYKGDAIEDNSIFGEQKTESKNRFMGTVNDALGSDSTKESSGSGSLVDEAKDLMSKAEKEGSESKEGGGILSWKIWPWNWVKS